MTLELLRPPWAAPCSVRAAMSTRLGGVSAVPCDSLDLHLPTTPDAAPASDADTPAQVARVGVMENRRRFAAALGAQPVWLSQVHGADVVRLSEVDLQAGRPTLRADAAVSMSPGVACTVMVADCLPVLMCSADGRAVGAAHAGWRGLAGGVLENTLATLCEAAGCAPLQVHAWLGACIGPRQFEVGADVLRAFGIAAPESKIETTHFVRRPRADGQMRWLADLAGLAQARLRAAGVHAISVQGECTVEQRARFFSYRRDGHTGRMAAAIAVGEP